MLDKPATADPEGFIRANTRLRPVPLVPEISIFVADEAVPLWRKTEEELNEAGLRYFVNAFWTAGQRRGHSLHEVSYRACFKSQLPGFFIKRLTAPGDRVYDPFSGRGTTAVEAAFSRIVEETRAIPGVTRAGASTRVPMWGASVDMGEPRFAWRPLRAKSA